MRPAYITLTWSATSAITPRSWVIRITAIPSCVLEPLDQGQDLGLDRDVERRGGLVGDQELRVVDQRHRDHRPLAHPAGELVRVLVHAALRIGDPDQPQQLDRPPPGRLLGDVLVSEDRLEDLLADLVERVERGQGVLEDHRDLVAAHAAQLLGVELVQVLALEHDAAGDLGVRRPGQAEDGHVGDALAAARLADDAERLALLDRERDAVHGLDHAVVGLEVDLEVLYLEQAHW